MDEKRSRRGFLKSGAALATGLTVGAVRPAEAQTAARRRRTRKTSRN